MSEPNGYGPGSLSLAYWNVTLTVACALSTTAYGMPYGGPAEVGMELGGRGRHRGEPRGALRVGRGLGDVRVPDVVRREERAARSRDRVPSGPGDERCAR